MNKRKANGHAEPPGRTNGHAANFTEQGTVAAHSERVTPERAGEASLANAAISAGAASAAQVARADVGESASTGEKNRAAKTGAPPVDIPGPTNSEAMQDAGAYVNAVAERVDLVAASARLLQCGDEKIAKAELDRLRDMKFGKVGPPPVEEQEWPELGDLPRPPR